MLAKLLSNHLQNDLGKLFLLLVIQRKYHLDYLFNFWATLHLLSPYSLIGASLRGDAASTAFTANHSTANRERATITSDYYRMNKRDQVSHRKRYSHDWNHDSYCWLNKPKA
jgi:hypothetical protein